tara:strand:+ start:1184 stop:1606 length:423 start_codon:yes stop_codon:yes gene_type:complete
MSTTTTIRRYRVETLVFTNNNDKVRLTSVVDARLDLCKNEIQIGTYAIDHFIKNMLKDELDKLEKNSTKRKLINEVIKIVRQNEIKWGYSDLNIFLKVHREDENDNSYEDQEVPDEEKNERFEINPFNNEVENRIEYEIS